MYVALSRVTSRDNLFLVAKYNRNVYKLIKVLLLNIKDHEKTDSTVLIHVMLIALVLQYYC